MASPGSSADEGEIVERHESFKTKSTTGAAASTSAFSSASAALAARAGRAGGDDPGSMDISSVDRQNRLHPFHRNTSPRGLKRQRAGAPEWGGRYNGHNGHNSHSGRGDYGRHDYDRRDYERRDYDRRDHDRQYDRRDRDRRGELRYDDHDDSPSVSGKRQRTRSRSPALSIRSGNSNSNNGNRGGRNDRDQRDRQDPGRDRRARDRDFDRNRDRDSYRDDRGRGARSDRDHDRDHDRNRNRDRDQGRRPNGQNGSGVSNGKANGQRNGHAATTGSAFYNDQDLYPVVPPPPQPPVQEEWVEPTPVDEEAEIERRRKRRTEIMKKARASAPMLAAAAAAGAGAGAGAVFASPSTPATPATPATDGVSPASPAEESLDLANDQDFINLLGKQRAGDGADLAAEDGPSAADYDPTVDMEEDERRDELRHGGTVAGLHGGDRRESLAAPVDKAVEPAAEVQVQEEQTANEDDDEDDMFAEDFVEKKYEAPAAKNTAAAANANDGALPTAAANGGGILEGDDIQGYYKIRRGEILDGRYQIQSALGKGMFSGVARAWDISTPERREVAIKMMRNNDALRKGGYTEIAILQKLNAADAEGRKHIVRFERSFDFRGHLCMVFESLSMNLREVLKKFGNNVGINLHGVRVYAYQIFVALAHMRRCSIVHADLKPDNILVNESRSTLKICDLGTAIDRSDAATAHTEITPYLVSRFYRAPEIILGMPYDYGVDMWSIGCTLYELYTGKILFTGESNNQMLRAIMEIRGKISSKLYRRGDLWRMHFDEMGGFLSHERDKFQGKTTIKTLAVIKPTRDMRTRLAAASAGMSDAEAKDLGLFHDLLDRCLNLNPDKRIQPADALKHPFFTRK